MKKYISLLLVFLCVNSAFAAEFINGRVRLVLNENTGRFSLYYMTDIAKEEFLPFFTDQDPRTSFLSLWVNNRPFKMGETAAFKTSIGGTPASPSLIFESSSLVVVMNFTFIRTGSSSMTNGVLITITVNNKSEQNLDVGLRFLIDTNLGEKNNSHFFTNLRSIDNETQIDRSSSDLYWVSKNNKLGLQGSITGQNRPDYIHFANWKRLNDAPWKMGYQAERNFNLLPYSIDDSAVCYYYESVPLAKGNSRTCSLTLSSEDENILASADTPDQKPAAAETTKRDDETAKRDDELASSLKADIAALRELVARLDSSIVFGVFISDEELTAISLLISRIKLKYSIP